MPRSSPPFVTDCRRRPAEHPLTDPEQISAILQARPPVLLEAVDCSPAAVAMILSPGASGLEVLFIERSAHPRDPWSGNLAFPGGRRDPEDRSLQAAAERETREEIGLELDHSNLLGRLDDIVGAYLPVLVAGFVYSLPNKPQLHLNHEVRRGFWFPLAELGDPKRHLSTSLEWHGQPRQIRGIRLDNRSPLLWGITYRLVIQFLARLGVINPELLEVSDD